MKRSSELPAALLLALLPMFGDDLQRDVKIAVAPKYGVLARTGAVNGEVSINVLVYRFMKIYPHLR